MTDLEESIQAAQKVVNATPKDHPDREADVFLIRNTAGSYSTNNEDWWNGGLPRDAVPCDDSDNDDHKERTDPLHWVPYVHFGV